MDIYFNDLTLEAVNNPASGEQLLCFFIQQILKPVLEKTRIKHIGCNELQRIKDKCIIRKNGLLVQSFYSYFRAPYDEKINNQEINHYLSSDFYLEKEGKCIKCDDLGFAIIKDTITLGLASEPFWKKHIYEVFERKTQIIQKHQVLCLTQVEHLCASEFTNWLEKTFYSDPEETTLAPESKAIKLRDDHGKDILMDFALRIRRSPYVISIINSMPFKPNQKDFINMKQSFENGVVEICLHWTPQGLGMVLQTTAKNQYQAKKIANSLTESYDQNA